MPLPRDRELLRVQRQAWNTQPENARKQLERLVLRHTVRPEVVDAILAGRRREVRSTFHERSVAFWHAVQQWGDDWETLAARLDYSRYEVQRRLKKLRENGQIK